MRYQFYAVFQAEALKLKGLKFVDFTRGILTIFAKKENARDWLAGLVKTIKEEQKLGLRTKDNLVKETGLDFLIAPITVSAKDSFL